MAEVLFILHNNRAIRKERVFRDRGDPLAMCDKDLIKKFRLPRSEIIMLLGLINNDLSRKTKRNQALLPIHQLCVALRFFAKGLFQQDNGDTIGTVQSAVSNTITRVTTALLKHRSAFIKFPQSNDDLVRVKQGFYEIREVPNVIGLIDGTHIPIRRPTRGPEEPLYVCRKGGHSINVQVVCDHLMRITDCVAKWPGSTHDAYIWRNCQLRANFEANPPNGFLLGDSGYPNEPWLYTAILQPRTVQESRHNAKIKGTRARVENSIGLLKSRFRCLDKSGGILLYSPEKVCRFVIVCVMLHNIRRGLRLQEDDEFREEEMSDSDEGDLAEDPLVMNMPLRNQLVNILGN